MPGVLLLVVGGVLNPAVAMFNQVQHPEEITVDELIDMRLQQLWDVSAEGVPEQTLATHTGDVGHVGGNVSDSNLTSTKPFHSRMVGGNSWFLNWTRSVWTRPSLVR